VVMYCVLYIVELVLSSYLLNYYVELYWYVSVGVLVVNSE
jgi:hypothetical protein